MPRPKPAAKRRPRPAAKQLPRRAAATHAPQSVMSALLAFANDHGDDAVTTMTRSLARSVAAAAAIYAAPAAAAAAATAAVPIQPQGLPPQHLVSTAASATDADAAAAAAAAADAARGPKPPLGPPPQHLVYAAATATDAAAATSATTLAAATARDETNARTHALLMTGYAVGAKAYDEYMRKKIEKDAKAVEGRQVKRKLLRVQEEIKAETTALAAAKADTLAAGPAAVRQRLSAPAAEVGGFPSGGSSSSWIPSNRPNISMEANATANAAAALIDALDDAGDDRSAPIDAFIQCPACRR